MRWIRIHVSIAVRPEVAEVCRWILARQTVFAFTTTVEHAALHQQHNSTGIADRLDRTRWRPFRGASCIPALV